MVNGLQGAQLSQGAFLNNNASAIQGADITAPFQSFLSDALMSQFEGAAVGRPDLPGVVPLKSENRRVSESNDTEDILLAQVLPDEQEQITEPIGNPNSETTQFDPGNINNEGYRVSKLEVTPFQFFLDKSVNFFLRVSEMERRADQLMERYARGEVSIEEMTVEKAKAGVAISFSVTMVNQVTQAFKELQNMQV